MLSRLFCEKESRLSVIPKGNPSVNYISDVPVFKFYVIHDFEYVCMCVIGLYDNVKKVTLKLHCTVVKANDFQVVEFWCQISFE